MYKAKFSAVTPAEREEVRTYVSARWSQLFGAARDARKDAAKFIAAINTGGAAAILTVLAGTFKDGSPSSTQPVTALKLSLLFFVLGVMACSLSHATANARLSGLFQAWRKGVESYYGDEITFDQLTKQDIQRAQQFDYAVFMIWMALGFFLLGAGLGMTLLL